MNLHEHVESEVVELSDYEIERDKPMPSRNHSLVQNRLSFILTRDYDSEFSFMSELNLALLPKDATPDICIYPKMKVNLEEDDVLKMTEPPLTAIEILSPKQALDDLVEKTRKRYFPNGVKSVWLVFPALKTIALIAPGQKPRYFTEGEMTDPATNIRIDIQEAFEV